MYVVKLKGRKISLKAFKLGFKNYEQARMVLKRLIRSKGFNADRGFTCLGYSIQRVQYPADIAQQVEQPPCKRQVVGSTPTVSTKSQGAYRPLFYYLNPATLA